MDAFSLALADLRFTIPERILKTVFIDRFERYRQIPRSIEDAIKQQVILPRVARDCNLIGGTEAFVSLEGLQFERQDDYTSIYRIPKNRTQGRTILSVLNVTFADPTSVSSYGVAAGCQNTTMMQAGQAVMDAQAALPVTSTAKVQLVGENTIMVRDTVILPPNVYVRVILMNDENLSHIQARSYPMFKKAVQLAVKSYIYNTYIIEMDMGELQGGANLGRFKEVIDGYADAEEMYQDYLTNTLQKVFFANDQESFRRFTTMLVGGYR